VVLAGAMQWQPAVSPFECLVRSMAVKHWGQANGWYAAPAAPRMCLQAVAGPHAGHMQAGGRWHPRVLLMAA
jgi:hypothetical protein